MADNFKPREFDLADPKERERLLREAIGYLLTCRREHHGTDFQGRMFAVDGLQKWLKELVA